MTERQLWATLQITTNEAVFVDAQFKGGRTGILDGRHAELLGKRQHTENAPNTGLSLMLVDCLAECADVRSGSAGASRSSASASTMPEPKLPGSHPPGLRAVAMSAARQSACRLTPRR